VDKLSAFAGDTLEYALTVSNSGTAPAVSVEINDTIPEFTAYIIAAPLMLPTIPIITC